MSRRRTRLGALLFGGLIAAGLALVPVTSASAHDFLVDSTPAVNSTVTAPLTTVTLTFNDLVLDLSGDGSSSVLEVTGPDGASTHFETGCPTILGRVLSAPVALGAPGKYQISWQIVSSDGHPVSNAIDFTYAPAAGSAGAAGSTVSPGSPSGPACAGTTPSTGTAALPSTAVGSAESSGTGISPWVILGVAGGIVVLAIVGVVVVLVLSRRSGRGPGSSTGSAGGASPAESRSGPGSAPEDPPEK